VCRKWRKGLLKGGGEKKGTEEGGGSRDGGRGQGGLGRKGNASKVKNTMKRHSNVRGTTWGKKGKKKS